MHATCSLCDSWYMCYHWFYLFFIQVWYVLCIIFYILMSLDVVLSLYCLLFVSFLAAISGCQNASPLCAHYCRTHAYLGSTSWVTSVRMCSVVDICYLCKSPYSHRTLRNVKEASPPICSKNINHVFVLFLHVGLLLSHLLSCLFMTLNRFSSPISPQCSRRRFSFTLKCLKVKYVSL